MEGFFKILPLAGVVIILALWRWNVFRARKAKTWPTIGATVQSGSYEVVGSTDGIDIKLPVFNFSYFIDGEHRYGRFSLQPYITDPGQGLIPSMIDRKIQVHYNPANPEEWYIPDEYIDGCRVGQKIERHFFGYPPK